MKVRKVTKTTTLYSCKVCGYENERKSVIARCEKSKYIYSHNDDMRYRTIGQLFLTWGRKERRIILCAITGEQFLTPPGNTKRKGWTACLHQIFPTAESVEDGRLIEYGEMLNVYFVDYDLIAKWEELLDGRYNG